VKKPSLYSSPASGAKKFKTTKLYEKVEWIEFRNKFLAVNDKCYACGDRSRAVDHVIAFKKDEKLFWDTKNYIPLCFKCHNTITANFDRHTPPRTKEKLEWINGKRMETDTYVKVKILDHKMSEIFIDERDFEHLI